MEFKSQICTSVEQSKRLLESGLKKETADCCYYYYDGEYLIAFAEDAKYPSDIPAWSLHRLMEIVMKGDKLGCITHNIHQNNVSRYYEIVITSIEHLIKIDEFNKDYLENKQ